MHDKFCIIDFEYVMHGSYNWTKTANFNDETLATALDRDFVKNLQMSLSVCMEKGILFNNKMIGGVPQWQI